MDFCNMLKEMFPNKEDASITYVVTTVLEQDYESAPEYQFENMVNLLMDQCEDDNYSEEGAVGLDESSTNYSSMLELFPDASPEYLWNLCMKNKDNFDFETVIDDFTTNGYEKIEVDPAGILDKLTQLLPDADPMYLKRQAEILSKKSEIDFDCFVEHAVKFNDYPTMADYLKNKKVEEEVSLYTTNFDVDKYLEIIPDPDMFYSDPNRVNPLLAPDIDESVLTYALNFLYNHYKCIRIKYIDKLFNYLDKNLTEVCNRLDRYPRNFRHPRNPISCSTITNIPVLQEITYLKHRKYIKLVIKMKNDMYRQAREDAIKYGLLETCQCCYDDALIPEECYFCTSGCVFCGECVKKGAETVIGKGEITFHCYNNCRSHFSLRTLQMVLQKNVFEFLTQRIQNEELRQANIEGLESCPFCGFVAVLQDTNKVFNCRNSACLKKSCRECKHESHIPKRCNEIECDEDVKNRTYVENKMAEALIRKCHKCKKPFVKSYGCNKMTCPCGALTCYLCGTAVKDYTHFTENICPLFTKDGQVDLRRVQTAAEKAKQDLGNIEIKFDPVLHLESFYEETN